jgi:predicted nucleotidyltransferase
MGAAGLAVRCGRGSDDVTLAGARAAREALERKWREVELRIDASDDVGEQAAGGGGVLEAVAADAGNRRSAIPAPPIRRIRYSRLMSRRALFDRVLGDLDVLAVYLFGSRADEGLRVLDGADVDGSGSDLDVGVIFTDAALAPDRLARLQVSLEDVFAPLRVDLVPLQRVDALFQFRAIDGHRIYASDSTQADRCELVIMRRAAELLPIERRLERDLFGVSTT